MRDMHPFSKRAPHCDIRWPDRVDERPYDTSVEAMMHAEDIARPNEPFNAERYYANREICGSRKGQTD
jgi:hypothetical protein